MNRLKHCVIIAIVIFSSLGESSARDISRVDSSYTTGAAYIKTGKYENAQRWFRAALEINPKHAPSYLGLGHVYLKRGDLKVAEDALLLDSKQSTGSE